MIAEQLDGRRIAITGGTGFLGTALIERLLRCVPGCQLVLLIRPGRRSTVEQRAKREIFGNNAFDRLREELGPRRVRADGRGPRHRRSPATWAPTGSASTTTGAPRWRSATSSSTRPPPCRSTRRSTPPSRSTSSGPTRIVETLHDLGVTPHLVSVSTCYVAGNRRGAAPEIPVHDSPFFIDVDWRGEVQGARQARADAEADSRRPESLVRFRKEARHELGAAGIPALAGKTEQRRGAWVKEQMVEAGPGPRRLARLARRLRLHQGPRRAGAAPEPRRRAGVDRAAVDHRVVDPGAVPRLDPRLPHGRAGDHLLRPRPAEGVPRRARGHRRRDPGRPGGRRHHRRRRRPSRRPSPTITQVASGSVNPLRYRHLVDLVTHLLHRAPGLRRRGPADHRPRVVVPGPRAACSASSSGPRAPSSGASACSRRSPSAGKQAAWAATLEEKREEVDRALAYVELYGAYAECEAIYGVDRLLERWAALDPEDQATFCFDPRVIDWDHYAPNVHLPSVVEHSRVRTTPGGRTGEKREDRLRRQVLDPARHFAAFDLENTLIASNVVASYSWLATRRLPPEDRVRFVLQTLREAPALLAADRRDRSDFLRHFYRRYDGANVEQLEADAVEMFSDLILTKSFPAAVRRVREHRALGHRTVLITGALDLAIGPLRPLFDDIVAPSPRPPRRRHLPRRAHRRAAHRRGARVGAVRLRRGERLRRGRRRRLRRLHLRPPDARGGRLPGGREPRDAAGRAGPQARLARRALRQGEGRPAAAPADRPRVGPARAAARVGKVDTVGAARAAMKALVFSRKPAKFAAAMVAGRLAPGGGAKVGPLSLRDVDPPELPGPGWVRLRPRLSGICGSDLATIDGTSSRWFEPIVSFPFTPGHEVVGDLDDGQRAVVVPVLSCVARGISPVCPPCAEGRINHCERIGFGDLEPGLQCGFCESTGGGWSTLMVAHESQLVAVPADLSDEAAVLVEPTACAVHAAAQVDAGRVALIGSGTLGLLTIAALRQARPRWT